MAVLGALMTMSGVCLGAAQHGEVKKVADYLYETTYTDYDYVDYLQLLDKRAKLVVPAFGCSAVHNGQFYGRNMDFFYDENPEFVLRIPKTKKRFASVGVALNFLTHKFEDYAKLPEAYDILPFETIDGINENGVAANINVCPANDLELYIAKEGTDPKKPILYLSNIVRYVLDNAKSAAHGVKLLQKRNIVQDFALLYPGNQEMMDYGLHMMVADLKEQYIVEWHENKLHFTKNEPIMTNFFNTLPGYTPHAQGVERYTALKKGYFEGGKSMEAMTNLMRRAQFSQAYDKHTVDFWYSDELGYWPSLDMDVNWDTLVKYPKVRETVKKVSSAVKFRRNEPGVWHTTNTSIYDLKNKVLRLFVQENYDKYYEYSL